jgi:hypothetical protein
MIGATLDWIGVTMERVVRETALCEARKGGIVQELAIL